MMKTMEIIKYCEAEAGALLSAAMDMRDKCLFDAAREAESAARDWAMHARLLFNGLIEG